MIFKKIISVISSVAILGFISVPDFSNAQAKDGEMRNITTMELVHDMGIGINLGNTMEACGDWISGDSVSSYETAWGSPVITQEMIQGYANAGFGVLRIPVAWSNLMVQDGKYQINPELSARVKQIADWTIDAGMYAIINIHWDNGWVNTFPENETECMKRYETMWKQICEEFKDYSDYLMFESQNEELGWETVWNKWAGNNGKEESYALVNKINQKFVDVVRSSGGNNDERHLLISGYNTGIDVTCDSLFKMPDDPADRCAVSVHYYSPSTFAILEEDADWGKCQSTWGTDAEYQSLKNEMEMMKTTFVDKGIPVIIGEYGCPTKNKEPESVMRFLTSVCKEAYTRGMCPVLWDTPGGRYDRIECKMADSELNKNLCEIAGSTIKTPESDGTEAVTYSVSDLKKNSNGEYIIPLGSNAKNLQKAIITVDVKSSENSGWYCGGGALTFDSVKNKSTGETFWSNKSFNYSGGDTKLLVNFDGKFADSEGNEFDADINCTQANLVDWWHSSEKYPEGGDDVSVEFKEITLYFKSSAVSQKIAGDANCDGVVDIADVVIVKYYLLNPVRYAISEQGIANADVQGNGNGLNANDAVMIQQYILGYLDADILRAL